jgi:hypothetical protein
MPCVSDERQRSIYLSLIRNKLYLFLVDSHFMAEMSAGVLVAVTDYKQFDWKEHLDVAHEEEVCAGAAIPLLYCN